MTKTSRAAKAAALERWADQVTAEELVVADTSALRRLAELADQREALETELADAVRAARRANHSWSEIGAMLGVSKQAAQRKYARHTTTVQHLRPHAIVSGQRVRHLHGVQPIHSVDPRLIVKGAVTRAEAERLTRRDAPGLRRP